jgi:hypothetical protein
MARLSDRAVPAESRDAKFEVYLTGGTYELFRHYHALPSMRDSNGQEISAVRGVLTSILGMIEKGATHLGVATDHVTESFFAINSGPTTRPVMASNPILRQTASC